MKVAVDLNEQQSARKKFARAAREKRQNPDMQPKAQEKTNVKTKQAPAKDKFSSLYD